MTDPAPPANRDITTLPEKEQTRIKTQILAEAAPHIEAYRKAHKAIEGIPVIWEDTGGQGNKRAGRNPEEDKLLEQERQTRQAVDKAIVTVLERNGITEFRDRQIPYSVKEEKWDREMPEKAEMRMRMTQSKDFQKLNPDYKPPLPPTDAERATAKRVEHNQAFIGEIKKQIVNPPNPQQQPQQGHGLSGAGAQPQQGQSR